MYRNPIPGVVSAELFKALLYGNMVGGLDLTVARASNHSVAWNTVTYGTFLAKCQRRWDFKFDIMQRFAPGSLH